MAVGSRADALVIEKLSVAYGETGRWVRAVRAVSMRIRPGEKRGLVGESGSGKTSLGRAVPGLLGAGGHIVEGTVTVAGRRLTGLSERQLAEARRLAVSAIFQDPLNSLDPVRTIGSQVAEAIRLRRGKEGRLRRTAMRGAVVDLLQECQIASAERVVSQYPHELSGGMRQRVAIAMAVAGATELIIADEPTTALDVVTQAAILDMLSSLTVGRGVAVLFITHNLAVAQQFCNSISVMYGGRLVEEGPASQVVGAPLHPYTRALVNAIPSLHGDRRRLAGIGGDPPRLADAEHGCVFEPRCPLGHGRPICQAEIPRLEVVGERKVRCHLVGPAAASSDRASG